MIDPGGKFIILSGAMAIGLFAAAACMAGPNQKAVVAMDYDASTPGIESATSPAADSQVTVAVVASGVKDLCGYSFKITFDPQKARFVGAQAAPAGSDAVAFLESNGGKIGGFFAKPGMGKVDVVASIGSDKVHAVTGCGVLAVVTFKKIGDGPFEVGLADVQMISPDLKLDAIAVR